MGVAAQAPATERENAKRTPVRGGLALFRALLAEDGVDRMLADADEAVANTGDDAWRCLACFVAGVARRLRGDRSGAATWLSEGVQLSRLLSVPSVEIQCLAQQAILALDREDWSAADDLSGRAIDLLTRFRVQHLVPLMPALAVSAVCSARRGETRESEHAAQLARRLLARASAGFPAWIQLDVRILLGHGHLLLSDTAAARSMLAEAQTALADVTGKVEFASRLHSKWRLAEEIPLATTAGPSAISPAELRVIQLLPTHLSFREIGHALYLSRNTVKTQAIAAYRKLGVNSRTEAVARARTFGLLDR
jgi:LuxR family maltose regulon positive regulatory protein